MASYIRSLISWKIKNGILGRFLNVYSNIISYEYLRDDVILHSQNQTRTSCTSLQLVVQLVANKLYN
jgi:hypothetical protein